MKLLVYECKSYSDYDLCDCLLQMNIDYERFSYNFNLSGDYNNEDEQFVEYFINNIDTSCYDAVFSIDFWPPLATACYRSNIKYIAYSYDCPFHIERVEDTLSLPNVYCFMFDRNQLKKYLDMGIDNIYHMPLSVNSKRYRRIDVSDKKYDKYRTQISFIGKLYDNNRYALIKGLVNDKTATVLDNILAMQQKLPNMRIVESLLTDNIVALIDSEMHTNNDAFRDNVTREKLAFAIDSQLTFMERILILNTCAKKYDVNFYSSSKCELVKGTNNFGEVNYLNEMPYIFQASDINLNQTLKAITSGVTLRVFDIVASGGFLLTNRQEELEKYFTDGVDVGVYDSIYDFEEKLDFYMSHSELRQKIQLAGRERCLTEHSMVNRISNILRMAKV